jgi:fucose permease
MMANIFTFYFSFKGADEDLKKWENEEENGTNIEITTQTKDRNTGIHMISFRNSFRMQPKSKQTDELSNMIAALKNPITWYLCFFVLFYQGAEVAMAGWIVTFLLNYRHGDPNTVGYVASGFWAGLTLGRLGLTKMLHEKVGSRRSVTVISLVSICLVILTWVIPNVIAAAVLISFAGVFIGPNYPLMVAFTTTEGLIPRKIQVITMTIMTAFGSSGGAIFPFLVGLLSQTAGTYVRLPVFLGLYSAMLILWLLLPNLEQKQKRPGIKLTFWQRFW